MRKEGFIVNRTLFSLIAVLIAIILFVVFISLVWKGIVFLICLALLVLAGVYVWDKFFAPPNDRIMF